MNRGTHDLFLPPPDHLVVRPARSGWRRVGIGTAPFNILSLLVLMAISSFVVTASGAPSQELAMSAQAAGQSAVRVIPQLPDPTTTTTSVPDALSAPAVKVVYKYRRPPSTTSTTGRKVAPKPITCDSFATQPLAQAAFDADRSGLASLDRDGDGLACEDLPGRVSPPGEVKQIPSVQALLRPYTRLYGVHTPNAPYRMSEVTDFAAAAGGKSPNTLMFFQNFSQEFPADAVAKTWAAGDLPMITLEPIIQDSTAGQPLLSDITAGKWDDYLTRWAAAAKANGQPIALRFAQEMNGTWYSWSDGRLGNQSGDYIKAWRHVHDLFANAGATNVIWVWSVNRVDTLPDKTLPRVYPGDNYVDWVGISGYYRTAVSGVLPSFDGTFAATLQELKKTAPSKLIMLTEVGAETTVANRTAWIASFFAGLLDHPEIIGFSWFNDFKDGDWRIQYAAATAAAFATGVADLRYGPLM